MSPFRFDQIDRLLQLLLAHGIVGQQRDGQQSRRAAIVAMRVFRVFIGTFLLPPNCAPSSPFEVSQRRQSLSRNCQATNL